MNDAEEARSAAAMSGVEPDQSRRRTDMSSQTAEVQTSLPPQPVQRWSDGAGYWPLVWRQYKRNRIAMAGLVLASGFFLLAILAPLLAGRLPFVWTDAQGVTSYPFFREYFAPADSREFLLERFFNYFCLLLPASGLLLAFFRKRAALCKWLIAGAALALLLPFFLTQQRNQPQDYQVLQQEGKGHGAFPLIPYGPYQQNLFAPKMPPTWTIRQPAANAPEEEKATYALHAQMLERAFGYSLLGSDEVGRDVLVRLLYGARVSLAVGFVSVGLATLLGLLIGALAGYYGGWIDILICRAMEIMMCFPTFFLILTIIAILDQRSILNIMLVIGLTGWTGAAQVIRGEIFKQRKLDYVAGARAAGASDARIIFRHILPNAINPVLVGVSFGIASAILTESGLSFLGLGVSAPTATWGELLHEGWESPMINWWLSVFPGAAIFFAMSSYNLVGEGLRDAMDPRLRS